MFHIYCKYFWSFRQRSIQWFYYRNISTLVLMKLKKSMYVFCVIRSYLSQWEIFHQNVIYLMLLISGFTCCKSWKLITTRKLVIISNLLCQQTKTAPDLNRSSVYFIMKDEKHDYGSLVDGFGAQVFQRRKKKGFIMLHLLYLKTHYKWYFHWILQGRFTVVCPFSIYCFHSLRT